MTRTLSVIVVFLAAFPALAADKDTSPLHQPGPIAKGEEKSKSSPSEYARWVQPYQARPPRGWFPGPNGPSQNVQVPVRLVVVAIEGDEPLAKGQERFLSRQRSYGCEIASDGRAHRFHHGPSGSTGGGDRRIPDADLKRLDQLLLKLPDDGARLPPPGRRLVLLTPEGEHCRACVYDRANAPDGVWEILHLSLAGIRSWTPTFKSESELHFGEYEPDGILALTPNGQLVSAGKNRQFQFWDPATHKELKELPVPHERVPHGIKLSPDGSLAVLLSTWGDCCVVDTKAWKVVRDFEEPRVGRYGGKLYFPQFTAHGRFLLFLCSMPDVDGYRTVLPRAYDTKTWQRYDRLPGLPENALTCIESPKGKFAVVLLKGPIMAQREKDHLGERAERGEEDWQGSVMALWDSERRCQYARLDEDVRIHEVAFSPDRSMVAIATEHRCPYHPVYHIRVWKLDTGELVHELRPFEEIVCENVVGLQWTADGQYVLAATNTMLDACGINVWNARSGRQRGYFSTGLVHSTGVVTLADGCHVAAGGIGRRDCMIRFWDLANAMKQIRAFEDSLAKAPDGK